MADLYNRNSFIVIVPEISFNGDLRSSFASSWTWLYELEPASCIWEYRYTVSETGLPLWHALFNRGEDLLRLLLDHEEFCNVASNPILFVCHGFGGLIVKRALTFLYKKYYDPKHQTLINIHAGIVFLGTPHPTYGEQRNWHQVGQILRSIPKFTDVMVKVAEEECTTLAMASKDFEECDMHVPVVSVYETRKTRLIQTRIVAFHREQYLLVDKVLAKTRLCNETLVGCDADHKTVCDLSKHGDVKLQIIKELVIDAAKRVAASFATHGPNVRSQQPDLSLWKEKVQSSAKAECNSTDIVMVELPIRPEKPATASREGSAYTGPEATKITANSGSSLESFEMISPRCPDLPVYLLDNLDPGRYFHGRKDTLELIDRALLPTATETKELQDSQRLFPQTRSFALCGMGGVGKTSIAEWYSLSRKEKFDAVFWVQADGTEKLDKSLGDIARALKLTTTAEDSDPTICCSYAMAWLNTPRAKPSDEALPDIPDTKPITWLLVFDNADKPTDLQDYWPTYAHGSILITSRDPRAKDYGKLSLGLDLQQFGKADTVEMLRAVSKLPAPAGLEEAALLSIAKQLHGFPILIIPFATRIGQQDLLWVEALEQVDEEKALMGLEDLELTALEHSRMSANMDRITVAVSFISLWALQKKKPTAKSLLEVLSVLDPDSVSPSILTSKKMPVEQLGDEALDYGIINRGRYYSTCDELCTSSLIVRNKLDRSLSMHRLLQQVLRSQMSEDRFRDVITLALNLLDHAWPDGENWMTHNLETWEIVNDLSPHVVHLIKLCEDRPNLLIKETELKLAHLVQRLGWDLYERGAFDEAHKHLTNALKIYEKDPGADPERLANTLGSLSALTKEINPREHLEYAQRTFDLRTKHPSEDILLNGMAYTQLASAYGQAGQYEKAIDLARQGRVINMTAKEWKGDNGDYYPFYAMIYEVLPLMALKRWDEADKELSLLIAWRTRRYGIDDQKNFQLGYALHMLANVKYEQGLKSEAHILWERALKNYTATMTVKYHRTGTVYVKLAEHYAAQGDAKLASDYFNQAEVCHALLRYFERELARTKYLKSEYMRSTGAIESAEKTRSEAVALYRKFRPDVGVERQLTRSDFDDLVFIWSR